MRSAGFHVFSLPGGQIAQANGKEPPGKADESVKEEGGEVPFLQQQEGFIHQRGKGGETAAQACGKKEPRFRMHQAPVEQTVEGTQDKTSQQVDCRRTPGERTCRIDLDDRPAGNAIHRPQSFPGPLSSAFSSYSGFFYVLMGNKVSEQRRNPPGKTGCGFLSMKGLLAAFPKTGLETFVSPGDAL